MDVASPEMVGFIVIPVETVVVCNFVLHYVTLAIQPIASQEAKEEVVSIFILGLKWIEEVSSWPLIVAEHSPFHQNIAQLRKAASRWLAGSPLFEESREELGRYLESQPGFSASGLSIREDGAIANRDTILLKQEVTTWCKEWSKQLNFMKDADDHRLRYRSFITQWMWARDDPLLRMFKPGFKGKYQEHPTVTDREDVSQHFESLIIADDTSTVEMHTPLTTRASSPALTEHPGNTANDDSRKEQPTKLPTLEYTAIIRTDTDEILFDLGSSDINQKTRKVLDNMKEMCTGIRLQDYGGKAKLQNIMDMASKMAKE